MADVICPNCNEVFHETTDKFDPEASPNGAMFRLKKKYQDNGWSSFPQETYIIEDNLICPECGGNYREANGKVRVDREQYEAEMIEKKSKAQAEKVPCPHCGELFKSSGLHFHIKAKHVDKANG